LIDWHRLLGITIEDVFLNSGYEVVVEDELSLKQQKLDVVIIKKKEGKPPDPLPDGLEDLKTRNLLTYKSHQDTLNVWAIEELCGHYVNYRKQKSPSLKKLLPAEDFGLYAVSGRYPAKLAGQVELKPAGAPGVYDASFLNRRVRVVVLKQIEQTPKNAPWLMFSDTWEKVQFGAAAYKWKAPVPGAMYKLFLKYQSEGMVMPYTREDFQREIKEEVFQSLTDEDLERLLKGLKPEDRLKGLKPEDRLKGLKPEDRLKGLEPEDRLKGLKPEEIEMLDAYLKKIKAQGHS
jgi:hypothetical protein